MTDVTPDETKEDLLIRRLLIGAVASTLLGFLGFCVVVAVLVSSNYNVMNWLE